MSKEDAEDLAQEMFLNALAATIKGKVINDLAGYTAKSLVKLEMRQSGALAVADMAKTTNSRTGKKAAVKVEIDKEDSGFDIAAGEAEELEAVRTVRLDDYMEAALDLVRQGGKAVANMAEITGGKAITHRRGQQIIVNTRDILQSNQDFKNGLSGQGGLFDLGGV
jgi:hypothetical protein